MSHAHTNPEVAVIDGDRDARHGIAKLLEGVGLRPGTYESAESFLATNPDNVGCVITEIRMPGMGGLRLQEEMADRCKHVPLIFHTQFGDVPAAIRSMKAGAFDFIEKPCSPNMLIEAIHGALRQSADTRRKHSETAPVRECFATLTPRERDVFRLVVSGLSNKVIARQLKVSAKTVEFHRGHVMTKMRADSVADLVRMSLQCPETTNPE